MPYETLLFEIRDNVAHITLNRPGAYNALSPTMTHELLDVVRQCERSSEVRAVILTGAGKAFCSGGDLKGFAAAGPGVGEVIGKTLGPLHEVIYGLTRMPVPVIGAINGAAAGAGMSFACACDIRIAAETAWFTVAYTKAGLSPDGSGTYFLPRLLGLARALDLALTNRVLTAQQAEQWGLVSRVVPDVELADAAHALAAELAHGPTRAFAATKRLIRESWNAPMEEHLEREGASIAEMASSPDGQEGIHAFVEKRTPHFTGQ